MKKLTLEKARTLIGKPIYWKADTSRVSEFSEGKAIITKVRTIHNGIQYPLEVIHLCGHNLPYIFSIERHCEHCKELKYLRDVKYEIIELLPDEKRKILDYFYGKREDEYRELFNSLLRYFGNN